MLALALATLAATTCRLMISVPKLARTLFPTVAGVAALGAAVGVVLVVRENGDGWQLFAVLFILTVLGEVLTPILDRLLSAGEPAAERPLATLDGLSVVAVRGLAHTIRIEGAEHRLADDEGVVVRRA